MSGSGQVPFLFFPQKMETVKFIERALRSFRGNSLDIRQPSHGPFCRLGRYVGKHARKAKHASPEYDLTRWKIGNLRAKVEGRIHEPLLDRRPRPADRYSAGSSCRPSTIKSIENSAH